MALGILPALQLNHPGLQRDLPLVLSLIIEYILIKSKKHTNSVGAQTLQA